MSKRQIEHNAFPNNDEVRELFALDEEKALVWLRDKDNQDRAKQYIDAAREAANTQEKARDVFRHAIGNLLKLAALGTKSKRPRAEAWDKYFQYMVPNTVEQVLAYVPGSEDQNFAKAVLYGVYQDCLRSIEHTSVIGFMEADKPFAHQIEPILAQRQLYKAELARMLEIASEARAGLKRATSHIASIKDCPPELELSLLMERVAQTAFVAEEEQAREIDACLTEFALLQKKMSVVTPESLQGVQQTLHKYASQMPQDTAPAALIQHLLEQLQELQHQSEHLNRSMELPLVEVKKIGRKPGHRKQPRIQSFEPGAGSMGRYKQNKQDNDYFEWD